MLDTSRLTPTSTKPNLRWRETALTFVWLPAEGPVEVAYKLEDKRRVVASCGAGDRILAVRQRQYPTRHEVLVVDDVEAVRLALGLSG